MGRAIVDNPENSSCLVIGWLRHHLGYQVIEGGDAAFMLAATKELNPVYIKGGDVSPGATSLILMFHPYGQTRLGWIGLITTFSSLDAGLFIGTEDKFVVLKLLPVPNPFIEIKNPSGFDREERIPGENPRSMLPRTDGVFIEPSPYGALTDGCYDAALPGVSSDICSTPTRNGYLICGRQLTSNGFDLNDQLWGEKTGDDPAVDVPQDLVSVVQKSVFATC